jgi:tetratricopeptide (TPR) repeat protein
VHPQPPGPDATPPPRIVLLLGALVAVATLALFLPSVRFGFLLWDDAANFVDNPAYRGLGLAQLTWMFSSAHMGHYIPVTWLTLGLDYLAWGLDPAGYHLTNVLLHAANGTLVFLLARRLLRAVRAGGAEPGATPDHPATLLGAAAAALFFALHPLRVESVAWVTERRDLVSGLFYLAVVLAHVRWAAAPPGRGRAWYGATLVFFVCGVLAKSMVVTLPVALLALDVYPLRRLGGGPGRWLGAAARRVWVEKLPLVAVAGAASAIAFAAVRPLGNMPSLETLGLGERLGLSVYGAAFYLARTLVPVRLSPLYERPESVGAMLQILLLAGAGILGLAAAALVLRRRWPALAAVLVVYAVTLLPVSGVFQNGMQVAADRYTYLPMLGWALLAGGGVAAWAARGRRGALAAGTLAAAASLGLAALTAQQLPVWRDSVTLWSHAVRLDPQSTVAANNLGAALLAEGRVAEAARAFQRTVRAQPGAAGSASGPAAALFQEGMILQQAGRLEQAEAQYRRALSADPRFAEAWNNLGVVQAVQARYPEALESFLAAAALSPSLVSACDNARRAARIVGGHSPGLEACDAGRR